MTDEKPPILVFLGHINKCIPASHYGPDFKIGAPMGHKHYTCRSFRNRGLVGLYQVVDDEPPNIKTTSHRPDENWEESVKRKSDDIWRNIFS